MHCGTARGPVLALLLFVLGIAGTAQALAAVTPGSVARPFSVRYAINTNGDIALAANTLMTCPPGTVETQTGVACADGQDGGLADDNYYPMDYVDVDGESATENSSSATLHVPAGATVLFAGLYWGAAFDQGETLPLQCQATARTGHSATNPAAAGSAWLKPPGGAYLPVNASVFDSYTEDLGCGNPGGADERTRYQAFADVTALVKAGGGGSYTIANVQAGTGADRHAGWSLVVAYQDSSQPARNLTIFDGFAQVALGATTTIPVNGFTTPLDGPVNTQLGIVSYEGDLNLAGDSLALNGATLSDAAHAAANFFHSGLSDLGAPVTGRSPDYENQLGFDASVLAVPPGVVDNGDTSASIKLSTTNDRYLPGVVYFRTDIYAPEMVLEKSVTDLNGGDVNPGDVLRYEIGSTNTGRSTAYDSRINDAIPPHTAYKPGSLEIAESPGGIAGAKTDPTDGDQAEFDATPGEVRFRIGTGAGPLVPPNDGGGTIAPGESFRVRFDVVVAAGTPDGTQILNTAILSSKDADGIDYTSIASAPAAVSVRGVPDVAIDKSHTGVFVRGRQGAFTLLVTNVGGRATTGTVVIDDTLPGGLGVVSASGTGWSCTIDGGTNSLHCERPDALAPGAAYAPVSVVVNVLESAPDSVVNTGVTGGGGETNTSNNRDDDTVTIVSSADVAIVKSVIPQTTPPGVKVTYTLVVTNNGASTAKDVRVADPLPAGLTFASVTPGACGLDGITVRCAPGDLTTGQSVTITVVAAIPLSLANKTRTNEATVSSSTPDPNPANNKDDATVTITAAPPSKLSVSKTAEPKTVEPGALVTFTITLKVPSKVDAKQVDVCDTLPATLVFEAARGATFSQGRACWHLALAKAGSARTFKITAKVDNDAKAGVVRNVVVATAGNAGKVTGRAPVTVAPATGGVRGRVSRVTG